MFKHQRKLAGLLLLLVFLIAIASCGGSGNPEAVAEEFVKAAAQNDIPAMKKLVDPDYAAAVEEQVLLQTGLLALFGSSTGNVRDIESQVTRNDGSRASVHVSGSMEATLLGVSTVLPIEIDVPLIKKNGKWYVEAR